MVKSLPVVRATWVQSLGQEDPLEKEMATHSSILAWRIPSTKEAGGLLNVGLERIGHMWAAETSTFNYVSMHLKMNDYTGVHLKMNTFLFIKIKMISKEVAEVAKIS